MANKTLLTYVVADLLFVMTGAVMMGFSIIVQNTMYETATTGGQAARNLLYQKFPITAGIVSATSIFVTFLVTIPGMVMPGTRGWLKLSGYMVTVCTLFTLAMGLFIWIFTLRLKESFSPVWDAQDAQTQGLMQTAFKCCGYFNSTSPAFVTGATCPSPAAAALMIGCATPISSFAGVFVDEIFTAIFGMVGIDAVLILATACLLKDHKERDRFQHIDEKSGPMSSF